MNQVNEITELSAPSASFPRPAQVSELLGRELDAAVAERVMNWEWWERPDDFNGDWRRAIFPPEGSLSWVRFNFDAHYWRPAQDGSERFSDWDECCRNIETGEYGLPRYSTDIAAAMEVVERMNHYPENVHDAFLQGLTRNNPSYEPWRIIGWVLSLSNKPEWICRAALAAVENNSRHRDREAATATT